MTTSTTNDFGIITLKDFAKQIGKSESTIRTWKRRGDIPEQCFKCIGGTVFIKIKEMQQWIEQAA